MVDSIYIPESTITVIILIFLLPKKESMDDKREEFFKKSEASFKDYFPFQLLTQIAWFPEKCPIQKKLEKLNVRTRENYLDVTTKITDDINVLSKRSSANSKIKIKNLKSKLSFLEKFEPYVHEINRTHLDLKSWDYISKKNLDFRHYNKKMKAIGDVRGLITQAAIYFYPNLLYTTQDMVPGNGKPFLRSKKCKSSSGHLIMEELRFFFVDIDNANSWTEVAQKIESFKIRPDVMIQTSERSFHLYWSIEPVKIEIQSEDKNGRQFDNGLILYELGLSALISYFEADRHRSNASSLMRVPTTWNFKPHKNKQFHTKYLNTSRTLEESLASPAYTMTTFISHLSTITGADLLVAARNENENRRIKPPTLDEVDNPTEDQVKNQIQESKKKAEFDFTQGWETALESFKEFFNIESDYLDDNDLIIFKQMWIYRLCPTINFPENVRSSLSGSGNKYSELRLSIQKLSRLPKRIGRRSQELIFLAEPYKKPSSIEKGKLNGYKVDPIFLEACGRNTGGSKTDWLKKISNNLYIKGHRNNSIPYDCFILKTILQRSHEEARDFLIDKIHRSANQSDVEKRCSDDTTNVDDWLRYFY